MGKAKNPAPESRAADGTFKPGESGNPGGMTAHQATVRRQLLDWLASELVTPKFKKAYLKALEEGDSVIVKDCADRLMGKVKLPVEVAGDPEQPLQPLTTEQIIAALTKGK